MIFQREVVRLIRYKESRTDPRDQVFVRSGVRYSHHRFDRDGYHSSEGIKADT